MADLARSSLLRAVAAKRVRVRRLTLNTEPRPGTGGQDTGGGR